jgi:AraC family transcriptional regulator of adaptative response/methylated-DNA-[protein]-cysteine methyltransferase
MAKGQPMRDLPDHDHLYAALLARDPAYEGVALVGVTSTGIYCRLTCPARKPLAQNCRWFGNASEARQAGFRACLRCKPQGAQADAHPVIRDLTDALAANPARRWSEGDVAARGHDPSTVRRVFRQHFGQSFLQMARDARLRQGITTLNKGGRMIDAQLDSGFDSASGFRRAFAQLFGHAPHQMAMDADLRADWIETPLGGMIVIADTTSLHLLEFVDRKALPAGLRKLSGLVKGRIGFGRTTVTDLTETALEAFFSGQQGRLDIPVHLAGTPFQQRVWQELCNIPAGQTRSYGQLAAAIGQPTAVRAVAGANGANRLALVVPCHRVIGSNGTLTGYAGGLWRKEKLIALEGRYRDFTGNLSSMG